MRACAQFQGNFYRTVPYTAQFADFEPLVLEEPADLPVAAFVQTDAKPAVAALIAFGIDAIEARRSVVQLNALTQAIQHVGPRCTPDPDAVLPLRRDCPPLRMTNTS